MNTVIFDLDGTITDPFNGITGSIQLALRMMGAPVPAKQELRWAIGPPMLESLGLLVGKERALEALGHYREAYSKDGIFDCPVIPGIPEALEEFSQAGWPIYLATSKLRDYAVRILDHFKLAKYFQGVHGSELDGSRAVKAELLAYVLKTEGFDPARSVMIGDRKHDAIGANANRIKCIGVMWGYGSREEFAASGMARVVEHPRELMGAARSLLGQV